MKIRLAQNDIHVHLNKYEKASVNIKRIIRMETLLAKQTFSFIPTRHNESSSL